MVSDTFFQFPPDYHIFRIQYPFYRIDNKALISYIMLYILLVLGLHVYKVGLQSDVPIWTTYRQVAWGDSGDMKMLGVPMYIAYIVNCILATITSVLTITKLFSSNKTFNRTSVRSYPRNDRRGSITILWMNSASFLMCIEVAVYETLKSVQHPLTKLAAFTIYGHSAYSISAFNPCIFIMRMPRSMEVLTLLTNQSHTGTSKGSKGLSAASASCGVRSKRSNDVKSIVDQVEINAVLKIHNAEETTV